jgi:hypothetical protein
MFGARKGRFFELPCKTGYGGLSLTIRVQGWADTRFRAVGHHKGGKHLLNAAWGSAGLVRTVVRNELIVHGAVLSSGSA